MQLKFDNDRVLAVVAHPDDAELLCVGTLARAKADGAVIAICVMCRGDKGQSNPPVKNIGNIRSAEMYAAAELLGAELYETGFGDGETSMRQTSFSFTFLNEICVIIMAVFPMALIRKLPIFLCGTASTQFF